MATASAVGDGASWSALGPGCWLDAFGRAPSARTSDELEFDDEPEPPERDREPEDPEPEVEPGLEAAAGWASEAGRAEDGVGGESAEITGAAVGLVGAWVGGMVATVVATAVGCA